MPLTRYQHDVVQLLAANRSEDSHLAGGSAIHIDPQTIRYSNDLDYFHDSVERVATAYADDVTRLADAGHSVIIEMQLPGYIRATVSRGGDRTKIEWAHDSAWRFMPTVRHPVAGYVLHPVDLAVNKLLALAGRDEARDFLDVLDLDRRTLTLGALCWAASGKDPGFTPLALLEILRRRGKYQPQDFARLALTASVDLPDLKRRWLAALDDADAFVRSRPPAEAGCLYYSRRASGFVAPSATDAADAVPHFGRPGGVLPRIVEDGR